MKRLTEKVIKADLAVRKSQMINWNGAIITITLSMPFGVWAFYHVLVPRGRGDVFTHQSGGNKHN